MTTTTQTTTSNDTNELNACLKKKYAIVKTYELLVHECTSARKKMLIIETGERKKGRRKMSITRKFDQYLRAPTREKKRKQNFAEIKTNLR